MLDLSIKGGSNCKDWAELPKDIDSATGGVMQDVVVMLWCQHLQHLQICCCCMMMMEVTHALVAIDNDFVTAYWCLVETVKMLQPKQPTTLTIKLTTGFKDQI